MGNIWDVLGTVIDYSINGASDFGEVLDDPDAYFGVELTDPENLWNAYYNGELPPFQENISEFINNPSVSTAAGIIPGVGGTIQTGIEVANDLFNVPDWVTGDNDPKPSVFDNAFDNENSEEEVIFESDPVEEEPPVIVPPSPTPPVPVTEEDNCCCCC